MSDRFERDLLRGSLDLMVLSVLIDGPRYGYLIQKEIRDASKNSVQLQAGTLYPLLHRLESAKVIKSKWDDEGGRSRKWYELTARGRKRLQTQSQQWLRYANCVQQLLETVRAQIPQIDLKLGESQA